MQGGTYEVGETVELLPNHAGLVAPPRDLAVEEVEEEAGEGEHERGPEVVLVTGDQVLCGHEYGEGAAYAVGDGDEVREPEVPARTMRSCCRCVAEPQHAYLTSEK